ncbi:hypothetical protein [Pseudarthrobacter sp. DSP2-3-2b1]|uniref:hypothetical protein n=1 Tax=Pseudarthrobacter sp. DSP2-3-2b1 TaxID=2804661 RepID=UPI003CFB9D10
MKFTKALVTAALGSSASGLLLLASSGAAVADHTHAKVVGNGQCVVLAEGAGEEHVVLPDAVFENNPNVDIPKTLNRAHPLHVLVHQGRAGENNDLYVYGTPAADAACAAGYVNR